MPKEIKKKDNGPMMLGKTINEVAHEMAKDLYDLGVINAITMREFDAMCLPPVKELSSTEIKKIRLREKVSQPIFAKFLNISPSTVKQWEQGTKQPRGGILKLLNLVADKGLSILAYDPKVAA